MESLASRRLSRSSNNRNGCGEGLCSKISGRDSSTLAVFVALALLVLLLVPVALVILVGLIVSVVLGISKCNRTSNCCYE